jgi:hypothetical protein
MGSDVPSSAHTSFRVARLRLQRAAIPVAVNREPRRQTESPKQLTRQAGPWASAGSNTTVQRPRPPTGRKQEETGKTLPAVCYGFFRKRNLSRHRELHPLPPIGYTPPGQLAHEEFSRTQGFHGGSPPACELSDCVCPWCLTRKSVAQEREELMTLYFTARAAGHVVDPAGD